MTYRTWRAAMQQALYGDGGFYHRPEGGPGHHFRTSSSASLHFARAIARLLDAVHESLGRPDRIELVEIAAARGALLTAVAAVVPDVAPQLVDRLQLTGIELADRPAQLPCGDRLARSTRRPPYRERSSAGQRVARQRATGRRRRDPGRAAPAARGR
jgi:hypothetical protein